MKVLFICTHNRCRSILAEAVTNHLGQANSNNRIEARSAGSQPVGEIHPLSIHFLQKKGISTDGLHSQSWDEFEDWEPDVVITVCDSAADEQCPVWFGETIRIHWGLEDPSRLTIDSANDAEISQAFEQTIAILEARIDTLLSQPFETYSDNELIDLLNQLESLNGTV